MNKVVTPHIKFMIDTIDSINANTPKDKKAFLSDKNAMDATLMRLQDIGEQLSRIRDNFPEYYETNQQDSWHKLIGLRNVISHGYREIDFDIIWVMLVDKFGDFESHIRGLDKNS